MVSKDSFMKKFLFMAAAAFFFFSCGSIDRGIKYPNMVADIDPFTVESIDATFDVLFSSRVKPVKMDVIFYPRENIVALEFRHELIRYRQFWDQSSRQLFVNALEQYKKDFVSKNLTTTKYNKSRNIYGRFQGKIEWETFKYTSTYKASPAIELGYRFRADNPYFTVLQRSAKEETGVMSGSNLESLQIPVYYTRAQGDRLAKLFDQDFLVKQTYALIGPVMEYLDDPEIDEY